MLVIAHHFINDPEAFWAISNQSVASLPASVRLHSVFPSRDLKTGTCVWEAATVGEVQDLLDRTVGNISKNVCYEVREDMAMGLPQKTMEAAMS